MHTAHEVEHRRFTNKMTYCSDADTQQNLAELSITDQQLKLGAAVSDEATPKEENAPTKPPSTEDVEMMDTDN